MKERVIETERLLLRKPSADDLDFYFGLCSRPENNLFNPEGPMTSIARAEGGLGKILQHWEKRGFGLWIIIEKSTDEVIGAGGLNYRAYGDLERLNLGFRLDKNFWGRGYAPELGKFAVQFAFNELKKNEVYGLVRPEHSASIKVLEKCGMTLYGEVDDVPGRAASLVYVVRTADRHL